MRVSQGRTSELKDWIGKRRGEWADAAFRRGELGNDKCWMVFGHYYSGCILLHCSGTLTHIPNCTLAGFSISFVHFPVVYFIQSLHALMNIVSKCPWAICSTRLRCQPAVVLASLLNMQIVHKQHKGPKLGLWATPPLWLPALVLSLSDIMLFTVLYAGLLICKWHKVTLYISNNWASFNSV